MMKQGLGLLVNIVMLERTYNSKQQYRLLSLEARTLCGQLLTPTSLTMAHLLLHNPLVRIACPSLRQGPEILEVV